MQSCKFNKKKIISFTTDFDWASEGIGIMKGIILSHIKNAQIIDLCHTVKSFSIINGCRQFEMIRFLPVGVHIIVVDPGVGTDRKAVAIITRRGDILLGPDNGVLINAAICLGEISEVYAIDIRLSYQTVFDGRDVFAYAAGLLGSGKKTLDDIGHKIAKESLCPSPLIDHPTLQNTNDAIVVHINHYGNLILNIKSDDLNSLGNRKIIIKNNSKCIIATITHAFANVPVGAAVLCDDSYGRVCVAINQGSAKKELKADIETSIHFELCD